MRNGESVSHSYRSLRADEWPEADQLVWKEACRPGLRLKRGGAASGFAEASREDFTRRYGAFLGFLERTGRLRNNLPAAALVTPEHVDAYVADLQARVSSVTTWNCVYKLRRAAELMSQGSDFRWLLELQKDLAFLMRPRSKFDRLVFSDRLAEAGLKLIAVARKSAASDFKRAVGIRNGLLLLILALCPIRLKNYAALEIGSTFRDLNESWWITLPKRSTKSKKADERRLPAFTRPFVRMYLAEARPLLLTAAADTRALWISSTTGRPFTKKNLGTLISKLTLQTLGVDVSPHLFRTAAATTAAAYATHLPHLASAVLGHSDPRVTEEHYNRATSIQAAGVFSAIIEEIYLSQHDDNLAQ